MEKNCVFCQLSDFRTDSGMSHIVLDDAEYQAILKKSDEYEEALDQLELSEKAKKLLDCFASEQNALGARYGILAYRLGFSDCLKLVLGALQFYP